MRKLFLDFDGVIVNTNKFIQETIKNSNTDLTKEENYIELCKSLPWTNFLNSCEEINNSFSILNDLNKIYDLTIITHFYSLDEEKLKIEYIMANFEGIKFVTVPFQKMKNEVVNSKGCILVDDYYVNIENWNSSGGIGLYFSNNTNEEVLTINNLKYLLDQNYVEVIGYEEKN